MEVDLTTSDDPPESHDQNQDDDTSLEHILPLELALQIPETGSCNERADQDETIPEESGTAHLHADSKAPGKSQCKMQQGAIFSGKILSFCCSECKDDATYSPNDLLKHFQGAHIGTLPTYPCDLCSFVTNEFSSLQRHRIGHRNTLVTCEICNDGVQYSLLWLTRHYTNCHSLNGHFSCKKCEFSTRDAGTFVQHIHHHNERNHKCVKSPHVSPMQGELQRHNLVLSAQNSFPFSCQICGYSAARREYLSKHITVAHGDEVDRTNKWKANEDNSVVNSSGLKLLLKKTPSGAASRESQWMSKLNSLPGVGLLDHNGRLFNPEKTLEDTQQFLERAVGVTKESNKWTKSPLKSEPQGLHAISSITPQPKLQEHENSPARELLNPTNSNGLTVLMVKNKISIPPNCTTKVMGFKMVDGKKHLVLKVIPAKQEESTENEVCDSHTGVDEDKTTSTPSSSFSPTTGSLISLESGESNETGAKKHLNSSIKEESQECENQTGNHLSFIEEHKVSVKKENKASPASVNVDTLSTTSKDLTVSPCQSTQSNGRSSPHEVSFCSCERSTSEIPLLDSLMTETESSKDKTVGSASVADGPSVLQLPDDKTTNAISHANSDHEMTVDDKPTSTNIQQSKISADKMSDESLIQKINKYQSCKNNAEQNDCIKIPIENTGCDLLAKDRQDSDIDKVHILNETTAVKTFSLAGENIKFPPNFRYASNQSSEVNKKDTTESNCSLPKMSRGDAKDCSAEVESNSLNSPSQEVFSFHNYSKDTSGSSPESLQPEEDSPQMLEDEECEDDFGDWSLTLPASPLPNEQSEEDEGGRQGGANDGDAESGEKDLERVSDSDIEVDECIATVDDALVPVLPEKEKEIDSSVSDTKQKDGTLVGDKAPANLNSAAVLGKILEKHSDAIISQQLEKERMSNSAQETVKPTKTTLRILQTPEGKQQMFLQTSETPYAVPVQLKSGAGFKLITKSCSPKINVSYVPGIETPNRTTGVALTLNGGRIGMAAHNSSVETKGQTSASSGNRFLVNAAALKGPILLSGAVKSSSGEQANNTPQTCYLIQRPVPVTPESGESSKTVLATRPVLAMPVKAADKTSTLQIGRQAYLVRYISPAKSGVLLNNSDGKALNQSNQGNEGGKQRVFLKIVRGPNGTRFLTTAPYAAGKKPVYLATSSLQSPCLLMSSHKSFTNASTGLTSNSQGLKLIPAQIKHVVSQSNVQSRGYHNVALQKAPLIPGPTRPQRKRRKKALFEDFTESAPKTRRISNKSAAEKDATSIWEPAAKDVERTLRLCPFSPLQEIKCPRRNQPVVVLNHPDADIPEVASIMRSVNKYKGEVHKVVLSKSTVKALSELSGLSKQYASSSNAVARPRPVGRTVAERFILKLKLKKTSRNKYEVVRSSSAGSEQQSTFCCWFCGRVFSNQEDWIGHGQRHLMEATRDWNKMF
ncbi:zinc finger protein 518A [Triplophysa rosa]|uniref:Zinc finger protein 518A n=1 Tax=Triplophysa rosa TaxID=992332 RepID=A0A9W7TIH9_TRIRA|nr:zinc finger protein 518A [Triplophysa rosa]KAI7796687.1 putative zinc finger protein 518A [Triplophysa rosa]